MGKSWFWVDIAVCLTFYGIGYKLSRDAYKYLRDRNKTYVYPAIYSPEDFHPEGEKYRRRAVRYWALGGTTLLAGYVVAWFVQRA